MSDSVNFTELPIAEKVLVFPERSVIVISTLLFSERPSFRRHGVPHAGLQARDRPAAGGAALRLSGRTCDFPRRTARAFRRPDSLTRTVSEPGSCLWGVLRAFVSAILPVRCEFCVTDIADSEINFNFTTEYRCYVTI